MRTSMAGDGMSLAAGSEGTTLPQAPTGKAPETVRVWLLSGFRVSVGPRRIEQSEWRLKKAAALVKLLALAAGHRLHREQVMDLLWPHSGRKAASNSLRQAIHAARKALDPEQGSRYLASQDGLLSLCPEGALWVDVEAFEGAARTASRTEEPSAYEAALDLYAGELVPQDRYEGWAEERRRELRELYFSLLIELALFHEERGEYGSAAETLRRVVSEEPAREEARAGLMRLAALSGRKAEALGHYEALKENLTRELGVEPSASSRAMREEIASGRFPSPDRPVIWPAVGTSARPAHNLPAPRTSFLDREHELVEVKRELSMTRLLTLTGVGGTGKTRLALEVARELAQVYPDGVWLVELAPLSEPALLFQEVAEALGVREHAARPLEDTLLEALGDKELLLVLDNCEHLLEASAWMTDALLDACSKVRILVTSREPLGIPGEVVRRVAPLSVPEPEEGYKGVAHRGAVRLFVERARLRLPAFEITPENASTIAEACRRLAGIPLAVELAAARVGALAVDQVVRRLEGSLTLLEAGPRTAPQRQRTMRASLEWSYEPLSEPERTLFSRLSVFAGGFTLEAAEDVGPGGSVQANEVLGLLSGLVDKSLVVAQTTTDGRMRYGMLEPVRQYARERLEEGGEAQIVRRRHAKFFLRLAEEAQPGLKGPRPEVWLKRLEMEHDNLRAALSSAIGREDAETGLRLGAALVEFWHLHAHLTEARRWLKAVLGLKGGSPSARVKALERAGLVAWEQGDYARAEALGEENLKLARRTNDRPGVAAALFNLGTVAMSRADFGRADALLEEAAALRRVLGDEWGLARALHIMGLAAVAQRDGGRATALYEESLALARSAGDEVGVMHALALGALAALAAGDHLQAEKLDKETVTISRRLGMGHFTAAGLVVFGACAALQERPVRSAVLWGAAESLFEAMGAARMPAELAFYEPYLDAARAQVDEAVWESALARGRTMSEEEAVEYAFSEDEPPSASCPPGTSPAIVRESPLTRREEEITALAARGLTNRQISAELSVSEHTVANHLARIRRKLGLGSRAQVAVWAAERRTTS